MLKMTIRARRFLAIQTTAYVPIFLMAGSAYLAALLIIHLLVLRLEPANV